MSVLEAIPTDAHAWFDLGPYRAEILTAGGGVHLRLVAGPFAPDGRLVTVANFMPDAATPAQLRALARHLDKVLMP